METPHHRKIELQSPADLSYLYTNTVALSRQKLDLHFPPSARPNASTSTNTNTKPSNASSSRPGPDTDPDDADSDPMKAHVRALVDEFIHKTFLTAAPSISINGLSPADAAASNSDGNANDAADPLSFLHVREAVEYEPYDTELAARVAGLYAQLESLTTTVAQLRRDAPGKAAGQYAEALRGVLEEDDEEEMGLEGDGQGSGGGGQGDVDMKDVDGGDGESTQLQRDAQRQGRRNKREDFTLHVPFGNTEGAKRRWMEGGVGDVYAEALRTLLRLQGETAGLGDVHDGGDGDDGGNEDGDGHESSGRRGLATTVGKVERAQRAAEVVEHL
ncbi:hypothetical protein GX51_08230 [Blastomyces parvus]|uniref:Kinetochore protein Mis14 n=1 Tax=Blastomyces parvus TaxID=2060905 RepID=A0A2B7WFX4_9EURO|nr:hypothetical protein GX51_08230 [Blastomyces parvus]